MAQATVSYTQIGKMRIESSGYKTGVFKLTFFDGSATYGTGLAIAKGKLGCPNELKKFNVFGHVDGYSYNYDFANAVLHIYQVPAVVDADPAAPMAELASGAAPAAKTIYVEVTGW